MRINTLKAMIKAAVRGAAVLLFGAGAAVAQQQVNLTAAPTTTTLPDGSTVPMWGYLCGAAVTNSTAACAAANPNAGSGWSPVIITVPTGQALQINLTNSLSFTPTGSTTPNNIPTSLMIVGQLGGGLGTSATYTAPIVHSVQENATWPIVAPTAGFTPPVQGPRVQSFGTEVAAGTTTTLTWSAPRPGTYLLESGTHPSIQATMGLIGMLVVTSAPSGGTAGTAYPANSPRNGSAIPYSAEVPLIFSEIDPVQNAAVTKAVNTAGFNEAATIPIGTQTNLDSIVVTNGGSGYTSTPTVALSGGGGSGATATAVVDTTSGSPTYGRILSINITNAGTGYTSAPAVIISGGGGSGGNATAVLGGALQANAIATCTLGAAACYPPVVNYTPLYYLINGLAFNKTNAAASVFAATQGANTGTIGGNVLVRMVNAGSHMHVPSIVGSQITVPATATNPGSPTAVNGFWLVAEDGNAYSGNPRVQSDVFMAAGKTYDVMINAPAPGGNALGIYDRELSLSANSVNRDAGMLAYIGVNGAGAPSAAGLGAAVARADMYNSLAPGQTFTFSDPSKGVMANDTNVFGVALLTPPANGTVTLNTNGTFTYVPSGTATSDSFSYCANGTVTGTACSSGITATVTLGPLAVDAPGDIALQSSTWTSNLANYIKVPPPGVLTGAVDPKGFPLTVTQTSITAAAAAGVILDANGGFTASTTSAGSTMSFSFSAQNSEGVVASTSPTVTVHFAQPSNLAVTVKDPVSGQTFSDYRWIIEEDKSFYIDPGCTSNPPPATSTVTGLPCVQIKQAGATASTVPILGVNFHTSDMTYVAQGCTGPISCESGQTVLGQPVVCDVGNGGCRPDTSGAGMTAVNPGSVSLDPTKRYYISVLPGDAADPFNAGNASADCSNHVPGATGCGHGMGGAPISFPANATVGTAPNPVTVVVEAAPYPPAKLSVNVFEDDFPLNGEQDSGGGVDVLATNERGLGAFNIILWDDMGGSGDATGQMTYDMFNQPLSNSLDGTMDPATGNNACPITAQGNSNPSGITGMITVCPTYESDGHTLSPLAGEAVIANLMQGRYSVQAIPGADRIAKGEEWLQTNTLDGQKAHDSFLRIGEPAYFQEFGPANYHVSIGFANPGIINARLKGVCNGSDQNLQAGNCTYTLKGRVTDERMSRTPDERLYSSASYDSFYWTQCYISVGDPDGEDFAFTKCAADGTFTLTGLPKGDWRVTVFDEWNDMIVDGLSTPVGLGTNDYTCTGSGSSATVCNMGDIATSQWQANVYTKTFIDQNETGVATSDSPGVSQAITTVRLRDGSRQNIGATDFTGTTNFNETFPLFAWYAVETDVTRYKNTGTHTVYDAGGPADGSGLCGDGTNYPKCGTSTIGNKLANTYEPIPLPANLSVPGSVYCPTADCSSQSVLAGPVASGANSTGRIDNPWFGQVEGWQGFSGQNNFIEFGKAPYSVGENGGIHGHVVYASTRPFDDPAMNVQQPWEPLVPNVTMNLYKEGVAADGVTPTLTLIDTTQTTSWDAWAQGFRADGVTPNMNCPGQSTADLFYFSLANQPNYLDLYNQEHATFGTFNSTAAGTPLPNHSQFKCYDGMHNWNQLQPAVYDGMYSFPSITSYDANGKPVGTNCKACVPDPATDLYKGVPMLPAGKYVVEIVPPPGYEINKEEDKNILIGDNFIAPVTQQFGGLGNIFILPDQASVAAGGTTPNVFNAGYNAYNPQNPTQNLGMNATSDEVPGFVPEPVWPCVGEARIVPDYISLFPQSAEVSPFAGATRNLCDRKEVTLNDQMGAIAKFYVFTSTHKAAKFTGIITDDFTSEFDPFSPQFGEKFSPPNMPVSVQDWTGQEIGRVYSDWWGAFDGLVYSTWEVNPPNPTGYGPNMMVFCMNSKASSATAPTDPLYNPAYSDFCYELPYMPGQTQYLDTPVVPTSAFSAGYNHPDCAYPDATPAVARVDGDGGSGGPWVSATGKTLTITALGNQAVNNYGYSGPQVSTAPYNGKTITRHYGFGSQCTRPTAGSTTCNTASSVTIGGIAAAIQSWSDTSITVKVPTGVTPCAVQQQAQYGGLGSPGAGTALCGELAITAGNGKQSIDAAMITIGGKKPTYVKSNAPLTPYGSGSIQQAIDAAEPGDLIIVPPGTYQEMVLMWKPVRLQGVGAASVTIDANTQPAGKMDPWRRQVNCLFELGLDGTPIGETSTQYPAGHPYDPSGTYTCGSTNGVPWTAFVGAADAPQVDRLPLEGIVGWDATVNGNLAQLLQEPTLMGAYEGAGITVLGKGVNVPASAKSGYYGSGAESTFPTGTTNLDASAANCGSGRPGVTGYVPNPNPSSFWCNPSLIDGLTVTDASMGGGGIFAHAWTHNLEISNNRVYSNIGTLSGGINIGQGEFPDAYLNDTTLDTDPGSCETTSVDPATGSNYNPADPANTQEPYCFQNHVNVHNNAVHSNTSIGDELFSGTPAGAGGVSFCTGSDYYKFNYNWVCGNMSTGDGGGFAHLGFIKNGDVEHNSFLFNQSLNPTIPTNGGGLIVMGAAPDGNQFVNGVAVECGSVTDNDCVPGLSDGTGPGLIINANLILGNAAEAGSGGGIRLQAVNGTDVPRFPSQPNLWYSVNITNNIVTNNIAGWDGGGISLQDALVTNIVNDTIASNDATATAGVLSDTLGAPLASAPVPGQTTTSSTTTAPQAAGLVTMNNSPQLVSSFAATSTTPAITLTCPSFYTGANANKCASFSVPRIANDLIWQNRSYYAGVGALSATYQQHLIFLFNANFANPTAGTTITNQTATGQCVTGSSYWDLGVRGDTAPGNHSSGLTLAPSYSLLTNASEVGLGTNDKTGTSPQFNKQYCNGSRTPPEIAAAAGASSSWNVPPGISDATVPNPLFNLTPAATVDEGNNWINLTWGPLSLISPVDNKTVLGNYALPGTSPAVDQIPTNASTYTLAPSTDFFGNRRPDRNNTAIDYGAVEYQTH